MESTGMHWRAALNEVLPLLAGIALLLGGGILIYDWKVSDDAPVTRVAAKVVGFGQRLARVSSLAEGPRMTVEFELQNGQHYRQSMIAESAARCRIGQLVQLEQAMNRAGRFRIVGPPDPCGT